jgi:hypothetical protein
MLAAAHPPVRHPPALTSPLAPLCPASQTTMVHHAGRKAPATHIRSTLSTAPPFVLLPRSPSLPGAEERSMHSMMASIHGIAPNPFHMPTHHPNLLTCATCCRRHRRRRATLSLKFVPLFMGTAFKNKGVQLLLDGVSDYLPCPLDVTNYALDLERDEAKLALPCSRCAWRRR